MHLLSPKLWPLLRTDPQAALDELRRCGKISHALVSFFVFWRVVFAEYFQNSNLTRATALAFNLLLTLIPLFTLVSFILSNVIDVRPEAIGRFLSLFLPFAPETVLNYIKGFFANARKLRGVSVLVLVVMSVGLFTTVEEAMNTIWRVTRPRSFYARLRTFTMVTVYSPILLIASFQVRVWSKLLPPSLHAFDVAPFILNLLAFAMLIWFAPNTRVRFKNAFWGAFVAAVLFEIERQGFAQYVRFSFQTQAIYGTFGIVVFFLISLIFVSVFILFGSEVAYVMQNFRPLLRTRRRGERRVSGHATYLGVRMLLDIIAAFRNHAAPPTAAMLEGKYELTPTQRLGILDPLLKANLVHRVNESEAFVPAIDFSNRLVVEVLDIFEELNRTIPAVPADTGRDRLTEIIGRLKYHSDPVLQSLTFGQLLREIETTVVRVDALKPVK